MNSVSVDRITWSVRPCVRIPSNSIVVALGNCVFTAAYIPLPSYRRRVHFCTIPTCKPRCEISLTSFIQLFSDSNALDVTCFHFGCGACDVAHFSTGMLERYKNTSIFCCCITLIAASKCRLCVALAAFHSTLELRYLYARSMFFSMCFMQ